MTYEVMGPPGDWSAVTPERWSRGWRRLALATGMLVFPLVTVAGIAEYAHGTDALVGYAIVAGFCCCCALAGASAARPARTPFRVLLGAMSVLFLAALPYARTDAFFLCAVIVSLAAVFVRRHVAPAVAACALASLVVPCLVRSWHDGPGWGQALAIVFTALTVYAFSEIARANRSLVEARAEVARLASEAERARIARDLHDLLGHSLTAITVKSGLARRLAAGEASRALPEITEVEQLTRQALAEVRAAVSGYREGTLANELARGRELLRASGITADLPTATDMVDPAHQELLGWAVREGLTNVARHARAGRCTVTLSASEVDIRDDGVGGPSGVGVPPGDGNGLSGLRERVAAAGGRVEAGPVGPRGWRLRVSLEETAATLP